MEKMRISLLFISIWFCLITSTYAGEGLITDKIIRVHAFYEPPVFEHLVPFTKERIENAHHEIITRNEIVIKKIVSLLNTFVPSEIPSNYIQRIVLKITLYSNNNKKLHSFYVYRDTFEFKDLKGEMTFQQVEQILDIFENLRDSKDISFKENFVID